MVVQDDDTLEMPFQVVCANKMGPYWMSEEDVEPVSLRSKFAVVGVISACLVVFDGGMRLLGFSGVGVVGR